MKYSILYIFLIAPVLFSCGAKKNQNTEILEVNKMTPILWDLMAAGEITTSDTLQATRLHIKDSSTVKFQKILQYYKLDKKNFFVSMDYYENNPEEEKILIDSLQNYGNSILTKLESQKQKADSIKNSKKITPVQKKDSIVAAHANVKPILQTKSLMKIDTSKLVNFRKRNNERK